MEKEKLELQEHFALSIFKGGSKKISLKVTYEGLNYRTDEKTR